MIMEKNAVLKENKSAEIAVLVLCLLIVLPLLLLGRYDRPSADDYDYALNTRLAVTEGRGFFGIIKAAWETDVEFYESWQGLYSSAFLLALQPGIFGEEHYVLTPYILFTLFFLCLFFGFRILNRHFLGFSPLLPFSAAAFVLAFLMLWLPCPVEGIYWYNGAMNYMPWVFVNFLNLCLLVDISERQMGCGKILLLFLSVILAFLTSGGNHVTAFANILLLLFAGLYCVFKHKKPYAFLPFAAACIGFLIMFNAPGTALRQSQLQKAGVLNTILNTLSYCKSLLPWLSLPWLLSLLLITPLLIRFFRSRKEDSVRFPLIPLLYSVMVVCGMLCVPFYAMSFFGDGRLTNVVWATFVLLSWLDYALVLRFVVFRLKEKKLHRLLTGESDILTACLAALILILAVILPADHHRSSAILAVDELQDGSAAEYAAEMDARFVLFKQDCSELKVPALSVRPELLFFADLGSDSDAWPNSVIGKYYGKKISLSS